MISHCRVRRLLGAPAPESSGCEVQRTRALRTPGEPSANVVGSVTLARGGGRRRTVMGFRGGVPVPLTGARFH